VGLLNALFKPSETPKKSTTNTSPKEESTQKVPLATYLKELEARVATLETATLKMATATASALKALDGQIAELRKSDDKGP